MISSEDPLKQAPAARARTRAARAGRAQEKADCSRISIIAQAGGAAIPFAPPDEASLPTWGPGPDFCPCGGHSDCDLVRERGLPCEHDGEFPDTPSEMRAVIVVSSRNDEMGSYVGVLAGSRESPGSPDQRATLACRDGPSGIDCAGSVAARGMPYPRHHAGSDRAFVRTGPVGSTPLCAGRGTGGG